MVPRAWPQRKLQQSVFPLPERRSVRSSDIRQLFSECSIMTKSFLRSAAFGREATQDASSRLLPTDRVDAGRRVLNCVSCGQLAGMWRLLCSSSLIGLSDFNRLDNAKLFRTIAVYREQLAWQ